MFQHMGNSTFHPIVAFLRYKRKNEEAITLTCVISPPPDYCIILTLSSLLLTFLAKVRLLISAWFHRQPCTLAVYACRTQEIYKIHKLFQ